MVKDEYAGGDYKEIRSKIQSEQYKAEGDEPLSDIIAILDQAQCPADQRKQAPVPHAGSKINREKGARSPAQTGAISPDQAAESPFVSNPSTTISVMPATPAASPHHSASASTVSAMERCDWSDLLVENCGHCNGAPDLWEGSAEVDRMPDQVEGTWTVARYDAECGCGCNGRISSGDEIVLAKVGDSEDWVLIEHARPLGYGRIGGGYA